MNADFQKRLMSESDLMGRRFPQFALFQGDGSYSFAPRGSVFWGGTLKTNFDTEYSLAVVYPPNYPHGQIKAFIRELMNISTPHKYMDGHLSGYTVSVEGLNAFLPVSKAAWFYHPEHDACGKAIAVGVEQVYASGKKIGNLVVSAYAPIRHLARHQSKKNYMSGATPYAIAMDHDGSSLIFPQYGDRVIYAPLSEATGIARRKGLDSRPDALTGYCWQLRISGWKGDRGAASLLDVLND